MLQKRGMKIIGPAYGFQACGDVGLGRMLQPAMIVEELNNLFNEKNLSHNKKEMVLRSRL